MIIKSGMADMNESKDNKQNGINKEYVYLNDNSQEQSSNNAQSTSPIVEKPVVKSQTSNQRSYRKLKKSSKKKNDYQCELCNKTYKTERGLLFHMCESKKRMNEKEHLYARIAFMAYIRFHQFIQPEGFKKRPKKYSDFVNSPYYKGFIEFGRYVADMNMNEPDKYIDFLIKNSVPLKDWNNDKIYELFITDVLKKEKPDQAVERSIKTMKKWASENSSTWVHYFNEASNFRILSNVKTGKISPWMIFNTRSGKQFLKSLSDNEIDYVFNIINPDYWNKKFEKNKTEAKAVSNVLKNAGL